MVPVLEPKWMEIAAAWRARLRLDTSGYSLDSALHKAFHGRCGTDANPRLAKQD